MTFDAEKMAGKIMEWIEGYFDVLIDNEDISRIKQAIKEDLKKAYDLGRQEEFKEIQKHCDIARREENEKCAELAEIYKHFPPLDWDKSIQDKVAIYSNQTVRLIANSIRSRMKPDTKGEMR